MAIKKAKKAGVNLLFSPPKRSGTSVLFVVAEAAPFANVGGLSRAVVDLAKALRRLDHDVRVFMPKFGSIDEEKYPMKMLVEGLRVPTGDKNRPELLCNIKTLQGPGGIPFYFLENQEYYELRANVYGYSDDHIRWALLSRGCLEFLSKHSDWIPQVIHSNDWHTGHVSNWLRTDFDKDSRLFQTASVFTIHNIQFHGNFDHRHVPELQLDDGYSDIVGFYSERLKWQDFLRRAIIYSDIVNTVSKTYSKEILRPEYGEFLEKLLQEVRTKLFGIRNGIDYQEFDPQTDRYIKSNFNSRLLEKRIPNKLALQEEFDLPVDKDIPVLGYVGRIDQQKGVDLMVNILEPLLRDFNAQFVIIGGGDTSLIDKVRDLKKKFPKKIGAHLMYNFTLPRLVFAGSDMMLYPSRFEPCGIVPMEAMRYGSIPIVRETGGLADTVEQFDPSSGTGTGFIFQKFDEWSLFAQVIRALEIYRQKNVWKSIQKRAMEENNSWEARAGEYLDLYDRAISLRRKKLTAEARLEDTESSLFG